MMDYNGNFKRLKRIASSGNMQIYKYTIQKQQSTVYIVHFVGHFNDSLLRGLKSKRFG